MFFSNCDLTPWRHWNESECMGESSPNVRKLQLFNFRFMNPIQLSKIINGRILFVVPKGAFKCFFFAGERLAIYSILWMVAKSCAIWSVVNIPSTIQLAVPSTVVHDFFHPQYVFFLHLSSHRSRWWAHWEPSVGIARGCRGRRRCGDVSGHFRYGFIGGTNHFLRPMEGLCKGDISPSHYGFIYYSTSSLGSWNGDWWHAIYGVETMETWEVTLG